VVTSGIAHHHDQFHFTWARHDAAGNEVLDGCDTGELDAANRIRRLVAFFKPPPRGWLSSLTRQVS
jgi:hypothetical protein